MQEAIVGKYYWGQAVDRATYYAAMK